MSYGRGQHPNSHKNGFTRRHQVDDAYFDSPTVAGSYLAGFLAADGNVTQDRKHLSLSVQRRDEEVLSFLRAELAATYPIRHVESNGFPQSVIGFTSERLCAALDTRFNIGPAKSLTLKPPAGLPDDLADAFVKGLIDGDGSVGVNQGGLHISFIGTREVCDFVLDRLRLATGMRMPEPHRPSRYTGNTWAFKLSDRKARAVYLHYSQIEHGLSRKWNAEHLDYCLNWRKKYDIEKHRKVAEMATTMNNTQIARALGVSSSAVGALRGSSAHAHFLAREAVGS